MIKKFIPRGFYLKRIIPYINKDIIKVIVGQRRVGKSYFMFQVIDYLKKSGVPASNIIYINKELHEFENIKTSDNLIKHVESQKKKDKSYMYLFDDVWFKEWIKKAGRLMNIIDKNCFIS